MKTTKILLKNIDFSDSTYNLSPFDDDTLPPPLEQSLSRFGILHPPILRERSSGIHTIVSGRKRLLFVKKQQKSSSCLCLIVPQDVDDLSAWELAIEERMQKAPLTEMEHAIFFRKILKICPIDQAAERFLPGMGLAAGTFIIEQTLPLAQLEEPVQQAVQNGELDPKAARTLSELSFRDRLALFDIIHNLRLSVSYQKNFIAICRELANRSEEGILAIVSKQEIREIICSEANLPQKATNLMKHLAELSSPMLSEAKKEFNRFQGSINLPKGAQLSHSQSFETDELSLNLKFKNRESFLKYWGNHKKTYKKD